MENRQPRGALKTRFSIQGRYTDIAHYADGRSLILQHGHNIVTDTGLSIVAGALGNLSGGIAFWQVGTGDPSWDTAPVAAGADTAALVAPVMKKPVTVSYWDRVNNRFSPDPTDTLDVRAIFLAEEANVPLREFGLTGTGPGFPLFNYVIHEKITKSENFNLERILRITVQRI